MGICLFTLDSLATNYLVNFQDIDISSLDYNQRIKLFNKKVISENFDIFKYLIVDEIQDFVNDRAIMLLKILQCTSCGYMLLGDKCQAIYDYSCNDNISIGSLEFYKRLEKYVDNGLKYEFTKNMRQNDNLLELSAKLRSSMLNDTLQNQIATLYSIVSNLEVYESSVENINKDIIHGKTAILTRNNGEAEYIHTNLLKYRIPHNISRGTQGVVFINKNISTIFWDYCKNNISKKDFILRYRLRIEDDTQKAEDYFDILKSISNTDEDSNILSMDNLIKGLQIKNDLPIELLTSFNDNLTISTIHKAKGQEFDTIYLLENNGTLTDDEIRIKYVALTRAKNSIKILKKKFPEYWFFKSSKADSRTISCSNHIVILSVREFLSV